MRSHVMHYTHTQKSHMWFMGDFCFMKTVGVHSTHAFNVFPSHTRVAESEIWNINWSSLWCHLRELVDQRRTDMTTVKYDSTLAKYKMHYLQCLHFPKETEFLVNSRHWVPRCMFLHLTNKKRYNNNNNNYNYLTYYIILLYTCMYCVMRFDYLNKHYIYILIYTHIHIHIYIYIYIYVCVCVYRYVILYIILVLYMYITLNKRHIFDNTYYNLIKY